MDMQPLHSTAHVNVNGYAIALVDSEKADSCILQLKTKVK